MKLYNTSNMKGHLSCYNILESLCRNENLQLLQWRTSDCIKKKVTKMLFLLSIIPSIYYFSLIWEANVSRTDFKTQMNNRKPQSPHNDTWHSSGVKWLFGECFSLGLYSFFEGGCGVLVVVTITSITSKQILTQLLQKSERERDRERAREREKQKPEKA